MYTPLPGLYQDEITESRRPPPPPPNQQALHFENSSYPATSLSHLIHPTPPRAHQLVSPGLRTASESLSFAAQ
jgi:hypothetical protein